jgi:hypothetical protein
VSWGQLVTRPLSSRHSSNQYRITYDIRLSNDRDSNPRPETASAFTLQTEYRDVVARIFDFPQVGHGFESRLVVFLCLS